ncbi:MAG: hypothetical protein OEZ06_10130 [Myxococcales bacterium]|nr:hypothetical protein [Myxococcales bacterium]
MSDSPEHTPGHTPKPPHGVFDERKNIDRIFYALVGVCAAVVLADFAYEKHGHFDFENIPGAHAIFGFVAYVGLVLTATQLRKLLKRDEDYYDD